MALMATAKTLRLIGYVPSGLVSERVSLLGHSVSCEYIAHDVPGRQLVSITSISDLTTTRSIAVRQHCAASRVGIACYLTYASHSERVVRCVLDYYARLS